MATLKYTGQADASITFQGKYQVETGTVLEDVPDDDANLLLQSGQFEVVDSTSSDDGSGGSSKKSSKSSGSSSSNDDSNSNNNS